MAAAPHENEFQRVYSTAGNEGEERRERRPMSDNLFVSAFFKEATTGLSEELLAEEASLAGQGREGSAMSERSTRLALGVLLESQLLQLVVILLVLLDVLAVFGEIMLVSFCTGDSAAGGGSEEHRRVLEEAHESPAHQAEEILHWISVTILLLFAFQQVLMIGVFRLRFFQKPMYVIDLVIIVVALILEMAFSADGGLLVILMLWRVVRVVHGFAVTIETEHHAAESAEEEVKKLRQRNTILRWRLQVARSYPGTYFRILNMNASARNIWHWWTKHRKSPPIQHQKQPTKSLAVALARAPPASDIAQADHVPIDFTDSATDTPFQAKRAEDEEAAVVGVGRKE